MLKKIKQLNYFFCFTPMVVMPFCSNLTSCQQSNPKIEEKPQIFYEPSQTKIESRININTHETICYIKGFSYVGDIDFSYLIVHNNFDKGKTVFSSYITTYDADKHTFIVAVSAKYAIPCYIDGDLIFEYKGETLSTTIKQFHWVIQYEDEIIEPTNKTQYTALSLNEDYIQCTFSGFKYKYFTDIENLQVENTFKLDDNVITSEIVNATEESFDVLVTIPNPRESNIFGQFIFSHNGKTVETWGNYNINISAHPLILQTNQEEISQDITTTLNFSITIPNFVYVGDIDFDFVEPNITFDNLPAEFTYSIQISNINYVSKTFDLIINFERETTVLSEPIDRINLSIDFYYLGEKINIDNDKTIGLNLLEVFPISDLIISYDYTYHWYEVMGWNKTDTRKYNTLKFPPYIGVVNDDAFWPSQKDPSNTLRFIDISECPSFKGFKKNSFHDTNISHIVGGSNISLEFFYRNSFENTDIVSLTIPKNTKEVNREAFRGCTKLKKIKFLHNVDSPEIDVHNTAFDACTNVNEVDLSYYTEGIPNWINTEESISVFEDFSKNGTIYLPSTGATIEEWKEKLINNCKLPSGWTFIQI